MMHSLADHNGLRVNVFPVASGYQANVSANRGQSWVAITHREFDVALKQALEQAMAGARVSEPDEATQDELDEFF